MGMDVALCLTVTRLDTDFEKTGMCNLFLLTESPLATPSRESKFYLSAQYISQVIFSIL